MTKEQHIERVINMSDEEFNRFLAFVESQIAQEAENSD